MSVDAPVRVWSFAAVPAVESGTESWIQLLKTGEFSDWRYGDFAVTTKDLAAMVDNFAARSVAVPGDYDHSFSEGQGSRAAGWTKELELRSDGQELWGLIDWTDAAVGSITSGEYRFISPEFSFNAQDETGKAIGPCLVAWALTNRPFLEGMAEVSLSVGRDGRVLVQGAPVTMTTQGESTMDNVLRERLGLAPDVSDEEVIARVDKLVALTAPQPDTITLTKAEVEELRSDATAGREAREQLRLSQRATLMDDATREGRLAPAMREHFERLYDQDPETTSLALAAMPVNPAFTAEGGVAVEVPAEPGADAPVWERVEARALALQQAQPSLTYEQALFVADSEIRPHTTVRGS